MARTQRLVLLSILGIGVASAATGVRAQHYAYPGLDACTTCKANVDFYGHYPTRWRPWPGESRMDIHFPQAIGAEEVRRPDGSPKPKLPSQKLEPLMPQRSSLLPGYPPADGGEETAQPTPPPPPAEASPQPPAVIPEPAAPATPFRTEPIPPSDPPAPLPNAPEAPPASPDANPDAGSQSMMLPLIVPPTHSASLAPQRGPVISVPSVDRFPANPTVPSSPSVTGTAAWTGGESSLANGGPAVRLSLGPSGGSAAAASSPLIIRNPTVQSGTPGAAGTGPVAGLAAQSTLGAEVPRREWLPDVKPGPSAFPNGPSPGPNMAPAAPAVAFQTDRPSSPDMQRAGYVGLTIPETAAPAGFESAAPPAAAPLLDGFCPVQLVENEQWIKGSPQYSAEWKGRVYWLSDANALKKFVANAERYTPALSGLDPVALMQGERKDGLTDYCVVYDGRLYMFSSAATLARFRQSPRQYATFAVSANP
ncbi:hypothetical protein [Thermopirellula anaerolimosa]